jgi:hypothetical protein
MKQKIVFVIVIAYLQCKASAAPSVIRHLDDLPYDSENHLASHIFTYTSSCTSAIDASEIKEGIFSHEFYLLEGEAAVGVFGHLPSYPTTCTAACLEKGTPRSVAARPMPHRYWINGIVDIDGDGKTRVHLDLLDFLGSDGCGEVEYGFVNFLERVSVLDQSLVQVVFIHRFIYNFSLFVARSCLLDRRCQ